MGVCSDLISLRPGVAVKLVAKDAFREQEGAALQEFNGGPLFPQFYGRFSTDQDVGLVVQQMDGSLQEMLETRRMDVESRCEVLFRLAVSLAKVHSTGWSNGNLTPQTIMFHAESNKVCMTSWGMAQFHRAFADPSTAFTTFPGGSPTSCVNILYRAPELLDGLPQIPTEPIPGQHPQQKADVFSMGCVFFYLLTGRHLLACLQAEACDSAGVIQGLDRGTYIDLLPPDCEPSLRDLLFGMLSPAPQHRLSALDVLDSDFMNLWRGSSTGDAM